MDRRSGNDLYKDYKAKLTQLERVENQIKMRFNDLKHQQKELIAGRFDNPNYTSEDKVRLIIQIESELEAKNKVVQLNMFK